MKSKSASELADAGASASSGALTNFAAIEDEQPTLLALTNGTIPNTPTPAPSEGAGEPPEETEAAKARKAKAEAKAKAAAVKKEKLAIEKHNSAQTRLATTSLAKLSNLLSKANALKRAPHYGLLPEVKSMALDQLGSSVQEMEKTCKSVLSKQAQAAAKGFKLDDLGFSGKDVTDKGKELTEMISNLEQIIRLLK